MRHSPAFVTRTQRRARTAPGAATPSVPTARRLRLVERAVDLGENRRHLIAVAGDPREIDDEMRSFHEAIAISFGFLAALLALMMFFRTRLVHLRRARQALLY